MESSSNPFDEFPDEVADDVQGLLHLGELSTEVEFCGHNFGLRTLRLGEELAAAKAAEPFRGTMKEPQAFITATIAMALTHVDGNEDFCPRQTPDETAYARARFKYMSEWFWPTHDHLYQEFTKLLERQLTAIRALQDLSQRSLRTSSPLADSFFAPGTLSDEIPLGAPSSPQ